MSNDKGWPVVQPLPKFIVQLGLVISFVLGHVLLFKDRRVARTGVKVEKPMGLPAYK